MFYLLIPLVFLFNLDLSAKRKLKRPMYDLKRLESFEQLIPVAVIGSGPAGFSTAITTSRAGMHTVVFEGQKPGGQLMGTTYVENWPGVPRAQGPEIMKNIELQAKKFGTFFSPETITRVSFKSWPFKLYTSNNSEFHALSVIIATGTSPLQLNIPGEREYWGKGVMSCAVCDSPFTRNAHVLVYGEVESQLTRGMVTEDITTAERIIEQVLQLAVYAKTITVVLPVYHVQLAHFLERRFIHYPQVSLLYNKRLSGIRGDGKKVTAVELVDLKKKSLERRAVDWVFIANKQIPATKFLEGEIKLAPTGHIQLVCNTQQTVVEGVFAAGNVSNPRYKQASTASGDGVRAGLDTLEFMRRTLQVDDSFLASLQNKLYMPSVIEEIDEEKCGLAVINNRSQLDALLSNNQEKMHVLVAFSPLCPDCKRVLPLLLSVAEKYKEKVVFSLLNCSKSHDLAQELAIFSIPTCLFFAGSEQISSAHLAGSHTRKQIEELLDQQLVRCKERQKKSS